MSVDDCRERLEMVEKKMASLSSETERKLKQVEQQLQLFLPRSPLVPEPEFAKIQQQFEKADQLVRGLRLDMKNTWEKANETERQLERVKSKVSELEEKGKDR